MSIIDEIVGRVDEGRIVRVDPAMMADAHPRVLYVTDDIARRLLGPWPDEATRERMVGVRVDFDHFSSGGVIVVDDRKRSQPHFKKIEPGRDEVWALRCRSSGRQMRAFGRFAACDVFVVTNLVDRDHLGGRGNKAWRDEAVRCRAEWTRLFHSYPPIVSGDIHDYISDAVFDHRRFR